MVVKEGILDAKNHTAVVFKENTHSNLSGEAVGGNLAISKNHPIMVNGRRSGVKAFGSKGGWKINKTLKVPGNRFKATESSRVSFAETMKMTANLISLELDRQVVKNLSTKEGERGCANLKFSRVFREYSIEYKPDIVNLLKIFIK
ncbi:hypothetical protein ES332_A13G199900v1 [Gossypium tomentosum]|uniref:Uncharacterized protein n=1 Tax=Gossypium tomentosum TaxID=34277 RepID=A0A5D2MNI0_GOSTO|nr:hypothetical protein ES332_A13G199900v1 [Gossypium tomentosum]